MKIGFTGTQKGMTDIQFCSFSLMTRIFGLSQEEKIFNSGDCVGSDQQAHDFCKLNGAYTIGHIPKNNSKRAYCDYDEEREPKEYLVRNHNIVDSSDILIATPGGKEEVLRSGTWATIRYAKKKKKPIEVFFPDGSYWKSKPDYNDGELYEVWGEIE